MSGSGASRPLCSAASPTVWVVAARPEVGDQLPRVVRLVLGQRRHQSLAPHSSSPLTVPPLAQGGALLGKNLAALSHPSLPLNQ